MYRRSIFFWSQFTVKITKATKVNINSRFPPFTSKHDDRSFWESELINQEIFHTLGIVDAPLQLVAGELVRYPDDHSLLTAVSVGRRAGRIRRRLRRRRRRRRRRVRIRSRMRRRRRVARIGDVGDRLADSAPNRRRAGRHLQWGAAAGAVDEHVHGRRSRKFDGRRWDWTDIRRRRRRREFLVGILI